MSIADWNAGIIRPVAVAPTGPYQNGAAPGMWTLDQVAFWTKQGLWPTAGLSPNYIEQMFSTYLYTGNGSTQTIDNGIDLAGKGGLVWFKPRNTGNNHNLIDNSRGLNKFLITNSTAAEGTTGVGYGVASFNSNGFSLNPPWTSSTNTTDTTQVAWTFRKQPKFFDIQTFTSDSGYSATVNHNLGSVPGCVIIKQLAAGSEGWYTYHRSVGTSAHLVLNTTAAQAADSPPWITLSSTQISFNSSLAVIGATYVAYIFAHDAGGFGLSGSENVMSCGSFTTDGSGNATVNLGYEPQWIMYRRSASTDNWRIVDSMRGLNYSNYVRLSANLADAEADTAGDYIHPTATGFATTGAIGASTDVIYIAIRRGPMAVPTLGTSVYNAIARTGTGGATDITGVGFSPDLVHTQTRDSYGANGMFDRLRGAPGQLRPASNVAEQTTTDIAAYLMDGVATGGSVAYINDSGIPYINHFFRRAPSFFDEVCYTGTGVARTVAHNLGVAPELIVVKSRSAATYGEVYAAPVGNTKYMYIAFDQAASTGVSSWNNTSPTSTDFTVGTDGFVNANGVTFVAWMFATCAGVSKVGSYTGTGTTQAIACGFTTGARFVLIKRTDAAGDWYYWDSARGIVAGNDPYLLMNTTTAEVTGTDYVDTSAAGFEISSTAPAAINANGGSYIFLAVA